MKSLEGSKVSTACLIIKDKIRSGLYSPGQIISANSLSKEIDMSRTPILEAFKILENEDLVKVIPQVGVVVRPLRKESIKEIFAAKAVLEGYMAYEAAKKCNAQSIEILEKMIEEMKRSLKGDSFKSYADLNIEFHEKIMDIAGNIFMKNLVMQLWDKTKYYSLQGALFSEENKLKSLEDHQNCVQAMINGDSEKARKIIEQHRLLSDQDLLESYLGY